LEKSRAHLERYIEITATIDAAIFDDGSFVGTNSSGFFERANAAINANRDLLNEVESAQTDRQKPIYKHIEDAANKGIDMLDSTSTPTDYYDYFKALYANDILQSRSRFGDDKALSRALAQKRKAWPKLHRK
jgi:hypothetical protein